MLGRVSREDRRWRRGARLAGRIDRLGQGIEEWAEKGDRLPDIQQRVRELAENQWGEPVVVVHLDEVKPEFDVPGRRADGTAEGKRLVRRFFWNILRGVFTVLVNVVVFFMAGQAGGRLTRQGRVTGPRNAQVLGLVDAARSAKSPWLVYTDRPDEGPWFTYSPAHVAVVDSHQGNRFADDTPQPTFVWQAAAPDAPKIAPKRRHLTFSDGSVFHYHVTT